MTTYAHITENTRYSSQPRRCSEVAEWVINLSKDGSQFGEYLTKADARADAKKFGIILTNGKRRFITRH